MANVQQQGSVARAAGGAALHIPGIDAVITSLSQFEKLLRPRTTVPSQRYARFLALSDEGLASAAVTTRHASEHLKRVLEDLRGRSGRIDAVLSGMSPTFFSQDHGWRGIIVALLGTGSRYTDYKLVAVADYRRYLLNCLDALNRVSTDRLQSTLCGETLAQEEERTELAPVDAKGYDSKVTRSEVFVRDLVRLPRGTTLKLRRRGDGPFELWLGRRRFRVETWSGASLVDEKGTGVRLNDGRNLVGRGLYNDVVVDPAYTDISRRHLILDLEGGVPAAITDLSSAGTYVSRALVAD